MYEGKCYSTCPERSYMIREKPKTSKKNLISEHNSLRAAEYNEQEDLLRPALNLSWPIPTDTADSHRMLCATCHFSCLRCHGPNDFDCIECAPDSFLKVLINNQGTCVELPIDKTAEATNILLVQLTSNEIILIAVCLLAIAFIIAVGGYFFFRHICWTRKTNSYTYNALNDEEKLRLTYSEDSTIAFKREVDSIIDDDSISSISSSDDDNDYGNSDR